MVNEIPSKFKREWGFRLADGLTGNVFYRLRRVYYAGKEEVVQDF